MLATVNSPLVTFLMAVMQQKCGSWTLQQRRIREMDAPARRFMALVVRKKRISYVFQGQIARASSPVVSGRSNMRFIFWTA